MFQQNIFKENPIFLSKDQLEEKRQITHQLAQTWIQANNNIFLQGRNEREPVFQGKNIEHVYPKQALIGMIGVASILLLIAIFADEYSGFFGFLSFMCFVVTFRVKNIVDNDFIQINAQGLNFPRKILRKQLGWTQITKIAFHMKIIEKYKSRIGKSIYTSWNRIRPNILMSSELSEPHFLHLNRFHLFFSSNEEKVNAYKDFWCIIFIETKNQRTYKITIPIGDLLKPLPEQAKKPNNIKNSKTMKEIILFRDLHIYFLFLFINHFWKIQNQVEKS